MRAKRKRICMKSVLWMFVCVRHQAKMQTLSWPRNGTRVILDDLSGVHSSFGFVASSFVQPSETMWAEVRYKQQALLRHTSIVAYLASRTGPKDVALHVVLKVLFLSLTSQAPVRTCCVIVRVFHLFPPTSYCGHEEHPERCSCAEQLLCCTSVGRPCMMKHHPTFLTSVPCKVPFAGGMNVMSI